MNIFTMDKTDLKKLEKFMHDAPREFRQASAGVLNSLAFATRKNDIKNIRDSMIIRNRRFVESSLRVDKARSAPIDKQIALAYSIHRQRFSGWEEQQEGGRQVKRTNTLAARKGNKRATMISKARLKPDNKVYRPEQFQGKSLKQRFQFMMRVLGSRGGGEFKLTSSIPTKRGILARGLYQLKNSKITKFQSFKHATVKRNPWRTKSLRQLNYSTDIARVWNESIHRVVNRYK